jgi:trigger factor
VEITEFTDGEALKFTAELDVRPELSLPDLSSIAVTVDEVQIGDAEVDEQLNSLRDRFATLKTVERAAQVGDYVQIDLAATVDGQEVPGGTASNISHEVGSQQLLPGLDEALVGMSAGAATTFTSQLAGGDQAGKDAEVSVTVRTVKEKQLPALDDDFAQLASEFDTLDELREDLRTRLAKARRMEQLYDARDKALTALVEAAGVPAPEGVVAEEVEQRKQAMVDELERVGASMEEYLSVEGKSEQDIEAELTSAASEGVKIQLVLDALAEQEQLQVTDDEFGHEIVHRAQRSGLAPQAYYDQLVRSGMAAAVYGDVRRGKALGLVLERVIIKDSAGTVLTLDELRGGPDADASEHEHDH